MRRTPLFDRHAAAGAKLVEFAGYEMPVQYPGGVKAEHLAVREGCGIFDVSHMGEIETSGPEALALLQRLLSNDLGKLAVGGAQYSLLCRADGGVLDDLFTYRLDEQRYLTVTNASNHERDLEWFAANAHDFDVEVADRRDVYAMLAVQGPRARDVVQSLTRESLPERMGAHELELAGAPVLVCGTGYTGEDGVELLCAPQDATMLWDELVHAGAAEAGLAARDTLRLEACFHLYGNELSEQRNPIEAGLGWCCKEATNFIGAKAVAAARAGGTPREFVAFAIEGAGIARAGNEIVGGGEVTSGTLSPCLGIGIGLAYVPSASSEVGTRLEIDVRGKIRPAVVHARPFVPKHAMKGSR